MLNLRNLKWTLPEIKKKVKILKDNEIYRVADVLRFNRSHKVIQEILTNPKYEPTLLHKHFTSNRKRFFDTLVAEKDSFGLKFYDKDYVLVHVRLGDDLSIRGLHEKNQNILLEKINTYDLKKKIIIVTACHYGHHHDNLKFYRDNYYQFTEENYEKNIECLYGFISKIQHYVEDIVSNTNIDIDMLQLVFSENTVACQNAGGFAKKIIQWCKMKTG